MRQSVQIVIPYTALHSSNEVVVVVDAQNLYCVGPAPYIQNASPSLYSRHSSVEVDGMQQVLEFDDGSVCKGASHCTSESIGLSLQASSHAIVLHI